MIVLDTRQCFRVLRRKVRSAQSLCWFLVFFDLRYEAVPALAIRVVSYLCLAWTYRWSSNRSRIFRRWLATKLKRGSLETLPGLALILSYRILLDRFAAGFAHVLWSPVKEAVWRYEARLIQTIRNKRIGLRELLSPDDYYDPHAKPSGPRRIS